MTYYGDVTIILEKEEYTNQVSFKIYDRGVLVHHGHGHDQEDAWQKAVRVRNYIQKYGKDPIQI